MVARDLMSRIWAMAESAAAELGLELVDLEHGGGRKRQTLRLFVDKPGGVDLKDCERMSRELACRFEAEEAIDFSYILEVSSPGAERPLKKAADFQRYAGRRIALRLRERDENSGSRKISGVLVSCENEMVSVDIGNGEIRTFPLSGIAKANLKVDWDAILREKSLAERL